MGIIIYLILALWFIVSVFGQFEKSKINQFFRGVDHFSLIPSWTFFGPNPGTTDYHLLFRDQFDEDSKSNWREIKLSDGWTWYIWLWNPNKRKQKVLSDAVASLITISKKMELTGLKTTIPYLIVLNYVSHLERSPLSRQTQFMIMESQGHISDTKPQVLFLSEKHNLPDSK